MDYFRPLALACLLLFSAITSAQTAINVSKDGFAIGGYDTVAYFTQKAALKGDPQFSHDWAGAKWVFSSATHHDLFIASPAKYAPQFGGHCAYAVGARGSISSKPA